MRNNSNQTGMIFLIAIVLGAAVYAFMFFGNSMEQQNISASFGNLTSTTSSGRFSGHGKKSTASFDKHSDLSGIDLPSYDMKSTSGANYAQTSTNDLISAEINQMDAQSMRQPSLTNRTAATANYANNQSQSFSIGKSDVQYISNPENPTKSDINIMLILDTHAAQEAMSAQQGSKRSTPALAAKTASVSTNLASKSGAKKIDVDPGEPSPSASLPVGDGLWILICFVAVYTTKKYSLLKV